MENELLTRIESLENWKKSLESADTIPYEQMEALKRRLPEVLFGEATIDFGSIAATADATQTMTVYGAQPGDSVFVGLPASGVANGRRIITAWVSATNTVSIMITNESAGSIDPDSGTFKAVVIKQR